MTTPIAIEPIYIGGQAVFVKFFALQRNPGDPSRIEGTFTLMAGEGTLTLDAIVGPQGIPGVPAPIMRPQYDSPITDVEDLPDPATLDDSDNGRGWYIDGAWHVWQYGEYHTVQGSIPGPPGITPDISMTAEVIDVGSAAVYGPIDVQETGTTTAPNFNIKIPGIPGPEGPSGAIESAADYDDFGNPSDIGDFLIKKSATKWGPGTPNIGVPNYYSIPEGNFIAHNGSEGRFLIASLNIPAQDFAWYPDVVGHVRLKKTLLSTAQLEVEVRIGDGTGTGETDPLCGLAPYDPSTALFDQIAIAHILPHFSDTGNPMRSISPDSSVARVPSGQAKTIYCFIHKAGGSGGYEFTNPTAQLRIGVVPVVGT